MRRVHCTCEVNLYFGVFITKVLTLRTQGHCTHSYCPHCLTLSSSSFYAYAFCDAQVYVSYVCGGVLSPSHRAAEEVQLWALVLFVELPAPSNINIHITILTFNFISLHLSIISNTTWKKEEKNTDIRKIRIKNKSLLPISSHSSWEKL